MIFFKGKDLSAIFYGKQVIAAVYKGSRLIWEGIRSCFGAGFWVNEKPWINDEGWRNND